MDSILIRQTIDKVEILADGEYLVPVSLFDTLFASEAGKILASNSLFLFSCRIYVRFLSILNSPNFNCKLEKSRI